jgi:hypothetical protein
MERGLTDFGPRFKISRVKNTRFGSAILSIAHCISKNAATVFALCGSETAIVRSVCVKATQLFGSGLGRTKNIIVSTFDRCPSFGILP